MSCEGCEQAAKAQNKPHEAIIEQAARYAKENNTTVGIYQAPDQPGGFAFIRLEHSPGIPILEIISPHFRYPA